MSGALEIAHPSHPNSYAAPSTDSDSDASSSTSNAVHTPNSLASMASPPPADGTVNGAARPLPHRKNSSPLMPPFMVSAPGKVIVYGEHAVVHGKV